MLQQLQSEFLSYLAQQGCESGHRLPTINQLAQQLGISTSKLREQLEVARTLGLVEVRPKIGIRTLDYSFLSGLRTSLRFALELDPGYFELYGYLRDHIEVAFWHEAVRLLQPEDKEHLKDLVERAWQKLRATPVMIPHGEHRELHLTIFSKLNNPFVLGLLEAYWDAYEMIGLNVHSDYKYLEQVWMYHQQMVEAIMDEDFDLGYIALVEHVGMLHHRPELNRYRSSKLIKTREKRGRDAQRSDN